MLTRAFAAQVLEAVGPPALRSMLDQLLDVWLQLGVAQEKAA